MPRALAIDYGKKRCGIAVTDPLNIIATALDTVATKDLVDYVIRYCSEEEVNHIILGKPMHRDGNPVELYQDIVGCKAKLKKALPHIEFHEEDERFTSKIASQTLVQAGYKKKDRQKRENIDKISAVLILQSWMQR